MSKAKLRNRIKALEDASRGINPCTHEQHRDLLLQPLQRRAMPLPQLDGWTCHQQQTAKAPQLGELADYQRRPRA